MRSRLWVWLIGLCLVASAPWPKVMAADTPGKWIFVGAADNDLQRALGANGTICPRFAAQAEALAAAPQHAALLILADRYPDQPTAIDTDILEKAAKKRLRLYLEYPSELPGMTLGKPLRTAKERAVVASPLFGDPLPPLRLLSVHACHLLPLAPPADPHRVHLVWAKVAGVDTAVFGLKDTPTQPLLFHYRDDCLIAATKLSSFVTGRYLPAAAWQKVWQVILGDLQPGKPVPELKWTPTVRPSYGPGEPLPPDAHQQAVTRLARWYLAARVLRHADWPKEALDRAHTYNTVRDPPSPDWPIGDGSLGMLEGYSSTIRPDGTQPMRHAVRNDCDCEAAMALAFAGHLARQPQWQRIAANLLDYTLQRSAMAAGPRADPKSPSYGLVGWALDHPGHYYGDDNARALLGVLAAAKLLDESRWDEPVARCLLANLRTTGPNGYRESCVVEAALQKRGWQSYWNGKALHRSPHYQSWLWACYLWTYDKTRFEPLLSRSKAGFEDMMRAYPDRWSWVCRSGQIERARLLLPLAWLVRVEDTPEHRAWLRRVAGDMLEYQDPCGAIRERLGGTAQGIRSNKEYGMTDVTLIQADGDPVADLLYTCNFAVIGLREAAAATRDPFYVAAEDKLAEFLCRIQLRAEKHPELDGAWYRAFDFRRWEYWASNADGEWGPWCTETGWCQPWIAATLALRQMKTSLWDLTAGSRISVHFDRYRREMLPDEVLRPRP